MEKQLCIVTAFSDNYDIGYICQGRNNSYAKKFGYDFRCEVNSLWEMLPEIDWASGDSTLSWFKIPLMIRILEELQHEWVMWVDADAMVINDSVSFDEVLTAVGVLEHHEFIIAKDLTQCCRINGGVFIIRNTQAMRLFMNEMWNNSKLKGRAFLSRHFHEQSQIQRAIKRIDPPIFSKTTIEEWMMEGNREVSFFLICDNKHINNNKAPCDWIFHAACTGRKDLSLRNALKDIATIEGGDLSDIPLWKVRPIRYLKCPLGDVAASLAVSEFPYLDLSAMRLDNSSLDSVLEILKNDRIEHLNMALSSTLSVSTIMENGPHLREIDAFKCICSDEEMLKISSALKKNTKLKLLDLYCCFTEEQRVSFTELLSPAFNRCLDHLMTHPSCGGKLSKNETVPVPLFITDGKTMVAI